MKKLATVVVLFLVGMTAQANQMTNLDFSQDRGIRYNNSKSITFVQKGITFIVHSNGTFTYRAQNARTIRNLGRRGVRTAPGHTYYGVNYANNYSPHISYDRYGNISRIGRNYITYNRFGNVQRIGNVSLRYNNGCLVRVGNMRISYNRFGHIINTYGSIY